MSPRRKGISTPPKARQPAPIRQGAKKKNGGGKRAVSAAGAMSAMSCRESGRESGPGGGEKKNQKPRTYTGSSLKKAGADLAKRAGLPRAMPHPVPYALDLAGICVFNFFLRRK